MEKPFDRWNTKKKRLDKRSDAPFYHAREIWWCSIGVNVGSEQGGTGENFDRPVLILKSLGPEICFVVPLTTSGQKHRLRPSVGKVAGKPARALLSQMKVVDVKRFVSKIGYLDESIFERIRKAVKDML